ncbi:hypothetical protein ACWDBD_36740 [Streptomyces sp. NPDC001118]
MSTRLDTLIAEGTDDTYRPILLADGRAVSVNIAAGADEADCVYLWPGLDAPAGEAWENEDQWEEWLTGGNLGEGRLFLDVPVQALRDLIAQHGGETPAAADDKAVTAPLAQLRAAGLRCVEDGDSGGYYVRVPLADGTQITFAGTTTNPHHAYPDVSLHHPVGEHRSWSAQWGNSRMVFEDVYDSRDKDRPYIEDTAALAVAIAERARRSGGSAPEGGVGESAEQLARKALAEWGISAHADDDAGNTWLVIGRDQSTDEFPDMDKPYVLLAVNNDDEDVWATDRPPVCPGDEWQVVTGDGTGAEETLTTCPIDQLHLCVAVIAEWMTTPLPTAGSVLLAALAKYGVTVHVDGVGLSYAIPLDPATPASEAYSRAHLSVADRNVSIEHSPAAHTGWTVFLHDDNGDPVGDPLYIAGDGEEPVDCTAESAAAAAFIANWLASHQR